MRRRENPQWSERQTPDNITPQVNLGKDGILFVDLSAYDRTTLNSLKYVHSEHMQVFSDEQDAIGWLRRFLPPTRHA